jgi:hypothetical protein
MTAALQLSLTRLLTVISDELSLIRCGTAAQVDHRGKIDIRLNQAGVPDLRLARTCCNLGALPVSGEKMTTKGDCGVNHLE